MVIQIIRAAIAGAIAWWVGLNLVFGQAQRWLAHPDLQSAKMMAIYDMQPLPRTAENPWLLPAGMLVVATVQACAFAYLRPAFPRSLVKRGLAFAAVAWALLVPWFEFYLPWNLMLEPTLLVLLEMTCWAIILALVGIAISVAFGRAPGDASGRG